MAPLHSEKPPVATPLVVSKPLWDSGAVRSVADLKGRKVGAQLQGLGRSSTGSTPRWRPAASPRTTSTWWCCRSRTPSWRWRTARSTRSLIGEPVRHQGRAGRRVVRLTDDFVDDFQVTAVYFDTMFATQNRPVVEAFLAAYIQGARDLEGDGYRAPENLAILAKYTKIPADIVGRPRALPRPGRPGPRRGLPEAPRLLCRAGRGARPDRHDALVDPSYAEAARQILAAGG